MFQEKRLAFFYAVSPVHMGSGASLGVIDNPVQRERHTGHPVLAGSGLKGAMRELARVGGAMDAATRKVVFGPDTNASDHAGAVSFSDGQLVAFPVRSLKEGFVYATSPLALARVLRLAETAGAAANLTPPPSLDDEEAVVLDGALLSDKRLVLESFEFRRKPDDGDSLGAIAEWLAGQAVDQTHSFFRNKLKKHLVLLSETQFSYFVQHSTVVEPHVRIDDISGTADDGGLFFTEHVPPETLFASLVMASQERRKKGENGPSASAGEIMEQVRNLLDGAQLQIGGDATTGRGQVQVRVANQSNE